MKRRIKQGAFKLARRVLLRVARAEPRPVDREGAERRVIIMLTTAWGMGGTIRANLNLARYLAEAGYEVELLSVGRTREVAFFGDFPAGVRVAWLEDRRPGARRGRLHRLLRSRASVLMPAADRTAKGFSLWADIRLVRHLRRRTGFLITTRPGLNLVAARLRPPGLVLIGQEQMHLAHHVKGLRRAMPRLYPQLDALTVLTARDGESYGKHLKGRARIERIPNTVREMGPGRADLDAPVVLAAGRLTPQKGYDMLVRAWPAVAAEHPDWRLRICGDGKDREMLERMIAESGADGSISLEGPARELEGDMEHSAVFVLSSRHEGLPLVLLEAMGKGMAVVSFDCPTGPADVIEDHRNGLLIPDKDVEALSRGLSEMLGDAGLRRRCGDAAAETARSYRMDAVGPQWESLMADLWAGRNGA